MSLRPIMVAAIVAFAAARADAHALYTECKLRGDRVHVEAFYDDDTPAQGATVIVRSKAGDEVARGTTDDTGVFTFARPAPGKYAAVVDAGGGHRTEQSLTIPTPAALEKLAGEDGTREVVVTAGPTRTERVRFPWLRVALGLASIGGLAGVLWLGLRKRAM